MNRNCALALSAAAVDDAIVSARADLVALRVVLVDGGRLAREQALEADVVRAGRPQERAAADDVADERRLEHGRGAPCRRPRGWSRPRVAPRRRIAVVVAGACHRVRDAHHARRRSSMLARAAGAGDAAGSAGRRSAARTARGPPVLPPVPPRPPPPRCRPARAAPAAGCRPCRPCPCCRPCRPAARQRPGSAVDGGRDAVLHLLDGVEVVVELHPRLAGRHLHGACRSRPSRSRGRSGATRGSSASRRPRAPPRRAPSSASVARRRRSSGTALVYCVSGLSIRHERDVLLPAARDNAPTDCFVVAYDRHLVETSPKSVRRVATEFT